MSDVAADYTERLNLREQVARIDRALDEAAKFRSERVKLDAEAAKLSGERAKLDAEAAKLTRDRAYLPMQVTIAAMAAGGALVGGTVALMRFFGG